MVEEVKETEAVVRLRELVTTGHLMKQAQQFGFLSQEDREGFTKKLNDEAHKVVNSIIETLAGG